MDLEHFIKKRQLGEGITRVYDKNGDLIEEHFDEYGGISIDFVSAEWCIKNGIDIGQKEEYNPDTFRFFKR